MRYNDPTTAKAVSERVNSRAVVLKLWLYNDVGRIQGVASLEVTAMMLQHWLEQIDVARVATGQPVLPWD